MAKDHCSNLPFHGLTRLYPREYTTWQAMKKRCLNQTDKRWKDYGGRGIKICREWQSNFRRFLIDIGTRPSSNHSLDRVDNNGNYEPGNVRWATRKEQQRNMRTNHILTYQGESLCIPAWADKLGLSIILISSRIQRGWSTEEALSTPVRQRHQCNFVPITLFGKTQSIRQWAKEFNISYGVVIGRRQLGWPIEKALTIPVQGPGYRRNRKK